MRAHIQVLRAVTVLGSALLLLGATAGVTAARTQLFTIEIDLDTGTETLASDSAVVCPTGASFTDFHFGAGNFNQAGSFHLAKLIVCDDWSGSFVIGVNAGENFVVGSGTTGGWRVVPGSGTGDYVGLSGGGSIVGVASDAAPIDLVDHYYGSLKLP
jgi:hypothetical protein